MVSVDYSEAIVEVLDVLKNTNEEYINKISKKFIQFLEDNKSQTYKSNIDYNTSINELNLKPKAQALLGLIYLKYWATGVEKINFEEKIKANEKIYQEELKQKYDVNNLFKNKNRMVENTEDVSLVETKEESFIKKLINRIKGLFRR